jgi:hypothetical protein
VLFQDNFNARLDMSCMFGMAARAVGEFEKSVARYPTTSRARSSIGIRRRRQQRKGS